jgi:hypothetical protein
MFITVKFVKICCDKGSRKLTAVVYMNMATIAMAEGSDVEVG